MIQVTRAQSNSWIYRINTNTHQVSNRPIDITDDGKYIAAGNLDKVYLFNTVYSTPLWVFDLDNNINSVAVSEDGKIVVAGTGAYSIYVINGTTGDKIRNYTTPAAVRDIAINANGTYIIAGLTSHAILYNSSSDVSLASYFIPAGTIRVDISNDGKYIAIGGDDSVIYMCNRTDTEWYYTTGGNIYDVAFSGDGNYLAAGSLDYNVYYFRTESSTPLNSYTTIGYVQDVALSDNGDYYIAGGQGNNLYFFSNTSSAPMWSYTQLDDVRSVAMSGNGSVAAAGIQDSNLNFKLLLFYNYSSTPWLTISPDDGIDGLDMSWNGDYIGLKGMHSITFYNRFNPTIINPGSIGITPLPLVLFLAGISGYLVIKHRKLKNK